MVTCSPAAQPQPIVVKRDHKMGDEKFLWLRWKGMDQEAGCTELRGENGFLWFLLFLFWDYVSDHQMRAKQGTWVFV